MSEILSKTNDISELTNTTEYDKWNITCHYNSDEKAMCFMECAALFNLEIQLGWDADFRPVIERQV